MDLDDSEFLITSGRQSAAIAGNGMLAQHYVEAFVELCTKQAGHDSAMDPKNNGARNILDGWQAAKT